MLSFSLSHLCSVGCVPAADWIQPICNEPGNNASASWSSWVLRRATSLLLGILYMHLLGFRSWSIPLFVSLMSGCKVVRRQSLCWQMHRRHKCRVAAHHQTSVEPVLARTLDTAWVWWNPLFPARPTVIHPLVTSTCRKTCHARSTCFWISRCIRGGCNCSMASTFFGLASIPQVDII
jgi:hypothetical protein